MLVFFVFYFKFIFLFRLLSSLQAGTLNLTKGNPPEVGGGGCGPGRGFGRDATITQMAGTVHGVGDAAMLSFGAVAAFFRGCVAGNAACTANSQCTGRSSFRGKGSGERSG